MYEVGGKGTPSLQDEMVRRLLASRTQGVASPENTLSDAEPGTDFFADDYAAAKAKALARTQGTGPSQRGPGTYQVQTSGKGGTFRDSYTIGPDGVARGQGSLEPVLGGRAAQDRVLEVQRKAEENANLAADRTMKFAQMPVEAQVMAGAMPGPAVVPPINGELPAPKPANLGATPDDLMRDRLKALIDYKRQAAQINRSLNIPVEADGKATVDAQGNLTITKDPASALRRAAEMTDAVAKNVLPKYVASIQRARDSGDPSLLSRLVTDLTDEIRASGADPKPIIMPLLESLRYSPMEYISSPLDAPRINPTIDMLLGLTPRASGGGDFSYSARGWGG